MVSRAQVNHLPIFLLVLLPRNKDERRLYPCHGRGNKIFKGTPRLILITSKIFPLLLWVSLGVRRTEDSLFISPVLKST
jgi:hypothetical protein